MAMTTTRKVAVLGRSSTKEARGKKPPAEARLEKPGLVPADYGQPGNLRNGQNFESLMARIDSKLDQIEARNARIATRLP